MEYNPPFGETDPDAPYVNGDPSIARRGSILPAAAAEFPQREIVGLIQASEFIPDNGDLQQLTKSVRSQRVNFAVDTGVANALQVALDPPLTEYKQGMPFRVLVAANNTGPSTLNVNSLGAKPIKRADGADLQPDDIRAGMIADLVDDGTNFQVMNYLGAIGGITNNYNIDIPYAVDSGTVNNLVGIFSPAITSVVPGDLVLVKVLNNNLGPVQLTVNALAPQPVRRTDGLALQQNDLIAGEAILLEWNVSYWQMMRLVRSQVHFKLTASIILYVRPDGSDVNGDGSANTPQKAFATIQRAIDYTKSNFLLNGQTVYIQLGVPGTYIGNIVVANMGGSVVIQGDINNQPSYVVQGVTLTNATYPNGADVLTVYGGGTDCYVQGFTFSPTDNRQSVVEVSPNATFTMAHVSFSGVAITQPLVWTHGGSITVVGNIHVYREALYMFAVAGAGRLTIGLWSTVINTHGVNFTGAFVWITQNSTAYFAFGWCTFTGGATGVRYIVTVNSSITTGGGGPTYLPGNQPGIVNPDSYFE